MPISSENKIISEEGTEKEGFVVTFTNGALEQLEELKKFIGTDDPLEVIKVGIAFVQRAKERNTTEEK